MFAGVGLAFVRVESLWLAWVLLAPGLAPPPGAAARWVVLGPVALGLLAGTVPALLVHAPARIFVAVATVVAILLTLRRPERASDEAPGPLASSLCTRRKQLLMRGASGLIIALFLLPFIAPLVVQAAEPSPPAAALQPSPVAERSWRVRIPGLPRGVRAFWHAPRRGDRLHALETCLRFRGLDPLSPPGDASGSAWMAGGWWMKEFYVQDGRLLDGYSAYLVRTLPPRADRGAHLILEAPDDLVPAARARAEEAVRRWFERCQTAEMRI